MLPGGLLEGDSDQLICPDIVFCPKLMPTVGKILALAGKLVIESVDKLPVND